MSTKATIIPVTRQLNTVETYRGRKIYIDNRGGMSPVYVAQYTKHDGLNNLSINFAYLQGARYAIDRFLNKRGQ